MSAKKYMWEEWFGRTRVVLVRGVDYTCPQSTMSQLIRNAATKHSVRVRLQDTGEGFVVEVRHEARGELSVSSNPPSPIERIQGSALPQGSHS